MKNLTVEQIETAEITYQIGKYYQATDIAALEELQENIAEKNWKMDVENLSDLLDKSVSEWRTFADNFTENLEFSQWQIDEDEAIYSQGTTICGVNVEITATIEL